MVHCGVLAAAEAEALLLAAAAGSRPSGDWPRSAGRSRRKMAATSAHKAQAAAAEAAAMEQELRKMDAEAMRARTQQEAAVEAQSLKAERAESSAKKGKSLGEWLFGL